MQEVNAVSLCHYKPKSTWSQRVLQGFTFRILRSRMLPFSRYSGADLVSPQQEGRGLVMSRAKTDRGCDRRVSIFPIGLGSWEGGRVPWQEHLKGTQPIAGSGLDRAL